ncbi:MAG: hypothetical protein RJA07_256 [Bacteroidota bacterium]|jgi:hypothetical protein
MKPAAFLFIVILFLNSCKSDYDQSYSTYQEFEKTNERNKGWFPTWINNSCSDLKSRSSINNNESIGKFSYSDNEYIDNIFSEKTIAKRINTNAFQIILADMKTEIPDWFIAKEKVLGKSVWLKDGFYFAKDSINHQVYFLCKWK